MSGKKRFLRILLLLAAVASPLCGQDLRHDFSNFRQRPNAVFRHYSDSLKNLIRRFSDWKYEKEDTLGNPYYFRLFSPTNLYEGAVRHLMGELRFQPEQQPGMRGAARSMTVSDAERPFSAYVEKLSTSIDSSLLTSYTDYPWLISYDETVEADTAGLRDDLVTDVKPSINLGEKVPSNNPLVDADLTGDNWGIVVRRPNFWTFSTNFSLQFMQTYVSDNWYKGGENNNSLLASTVIKANYNNKRKVSFENTLEMKLGFLTSEGDNLHKYKTNNDLIRLTNKLGLQAIGRWNYTAMLQSWTQFYRGYKSNDSHVYSDFMSPFESVFSLGMSYKLSNVKNLTLDATLSPFSVNFKYVDRLYLATSFGLKEGHHTKFEYGSNITVTYTWNIWKNIQWTGRIYYFTDYSKVQLEWENTFNLKINKFLTTKLFLYPRFDDSATRLEGKSYFQFNENLSVGLDVSF